jgi:hypothetical protein
VVVDNARMTSVDYGALVEEAAELGAIYAQDFRTHRENLAGAGPFIAEIVRRQAEQPLAFNRWLLAGDGLAGEHE